MVASNRFFSEVAVHTENSGANTAQQHIVTLPHVFAMDARQILQQWKQIADNMSSQLNLAEEPAVAPNAKTRNLELMLPTWSRPVAEVVTPPPGAAVEVDEVLPLITPPEHMRAAQEPQYQPRHQPGAVHRAHRRGELAAVQVRPYMPPE